MRKIRGGRGGVMLMAESYARGVVRAAGAARAAGATRGWRRRLTGRVRSMRSMRSMRSGAIDVRRRATTARKTPRPPVMTGGRRQSRSAEAGVSSSDDALDVRGVQSLISGLDLELDFLALGEGLEAIHLDRGEMHEHVLAALLLNEAVALGVIEPLHLPSGHTICLQRGYLPALRVAGGVASGGSRRLYRTAWFLCQENAKRHNRIPAPTASTIRRLSSTRMRGRS